MNINDYDAHIRLADTTQSKVELPSEYDIVKNPPTKMLVADGGLVVNGKLIREQEVFLAWAYKEYFSVMGEVTCYYFFGNSGRSGVSNKYSFPRNSVVLENYSRDIVSDTTTSESSNTTKGKWNSKYALLAFRKAYLDEYSLSLNQASSDELITQFGDYTRTVTNKGDPLKLDYVVPVNILVNIAKTCLNGGFGEYIYYSDYPFSLSSATPIVASDTYSSGGFKLGKRYDVDWDLPAISTDAYIYQVSDESVDTIDYTSVIIDADFSSSHVSGFDVFVHIDCYYDSVDYDIGGVSGGMKGNKAISFGPFSFNGNNCTISLSDLGITSGEVLLKMMKEKTGFEFLTVDKDTILYFEEYNVTGSAQYGFIEAHSIAVYLLPKLNYGIA